MVQVQVQFIDKVAIVLVVQEQVRNIQMTVDTSEAKIMPPRRDSADHRGDC